MKLEMIGNRIVAAFWNREVIGLLKKNEVSGGANVRVTRVPQGQLVSLGDGAVYRHPWFTSPAWDAEKERWSATVRPGFVNGEDPRVPGAEAEKAKATGETDVVVGLCDGPDVPLHGYFQPERWPKFFDSLGVREDKSPFSIDATVGRITLDATQREEDKTPRRYLQAVEIYLSKARPTYSMQATVQGNLVLGQIVDYTVGYDSRAVEQNGTRARLYVGQMPEKPNTSLSMRLLGVMGDDGEDRALVATVYFLSPENWKPPEKGWAAPDSTWTPFVKHGLFWNLCHASKNLPPVNTKQSADPFLAVFVGRYTVAPQATLGAMEAEIQRLLAAANNESSNEGKYWSV